MYLKATKELTTFRAAGHHITPKKLEMATRQSTKPQITLLLFYGTSRNDLMVYINDEFFPTVLRTLIL